MSSCVHCTTSFFFTFSVPILLFDRAASILPPTVENGMRRQVLSQLFRRLLLQKLRAAHNAGQLQFFGQHAHLAEPKAFAAYLTPLRKIEWYLYLKPFGGPEAVLAYLSCYTHRVAIANTRLIVFNETGVTFRYKDYRADGRARHKTMTLATDEFIRRFFIHVLPHGFHRIRHYGLFANGNRAANIARARDLPRRAISPQTTRDLQGHSRSRPAAHAATSMSLLRRPHDHHRDVRTRLRADPLPHTGSGTDQDRHLMTASPPTNNHPDTRSACQLAAGKAQVRLGPLNRHSVATQTAPNMPCLPKPYCSHLTAAPTPAAQPPPLKFPKPHAALKSP